MACRIRKSAEWTMRLTHELDEFGGEGVFVTLTYNDEWIPKCGTLSKRDLQLFFKRLRKNLKDRKIKYFACGEYGEKGGRPHYHAIILGLRSWNESDCNVIRLSWPYCDWNLVNSKAIGYVSPDSMRYTTDYIQKKFMSFNKEEIKAYYNGRQAPFQVQSKGIGEAFTLSQTAELEKTGKVRYRGKEMSLPRYYNSKVTVDDDVKKENHRSFLKRLYEKYDKPYWARLIAPQFEGRVLNSKYRASLGQTEKNLCKRAEIAKLRKK